MLLFARVAALALLALMGWLMFSGVRGDSVTFDEQPHVAAGYTYLTRRSLDFNVEHPPLVKDLAAFPLLFMKLDFSWDVPDWFNGDPWEFGRKLLDHSNDDPDGTMFAVRVPMILVTLLLGWLLFAWTSRHYGSLAAIIALVLYVFSPTILAHGRLVTTDVGAAAGFFIGLSAFLRFLQAPTGKNIFMAGGALGLALLAKFSTFLLVPVFVFLALAWGLLNRRAAPIASQVIPRTWGSPVRWTRGALLLALPKFARPHHSAAPRAAGAPRLSAASAAAARGGESPARRPCAQWGNW
jgi:hypothetical protein